MILADQPQLRVFVKLGKMPLVRNAPAMAYMVTAAGKVYVAEAARGARIRPANRSIYYRTVADLLAAEYVEVADLVAARAAVDAEALESRGSYICGPEWVPNTGESSACN